jgi:hypothetical protein
LASELTRADEYDWRRFARHDVIGVTLTRMGLELEYQW